MKDVAAASDLLKPYDARLMRCYPISTRINHVADSLTNPLQTLESFSFRDASHICV